MFLAGGMEVGAVVSQEFYVKIQVVDVLFDIGLQLEAVFLLDGALECTGEDLDRMARRWWREFISGQRGRGCIAVIQICF